jgi:hypothetical protein
MTHTDRRVVFLSGAAASAVLFAALGVLDRPRAALEAAIRQKIRSEPDQLNLAACRAGLELRRAIEARGHVERVRPQ